MMLSKLDRLKSQEKECFNMLGLQYYHLTMLIFNDRPLTEKIEIQDEINRLNAEFELIKKNISSFTKPFGYPE